MILLKRCNGQARGAEAEKVGWTRGFRKPMAKAGNSE
jgi:hypothetical protein